MKFLAEYLTTNDDDFFDNNFSDDIAMWIDWHEEDENIITYCEEILQTGHLSVQTLDADNERGFEITINYKGKKTKIPYESTEADRDTTLITLNQAIQPDFEIRLCTESLDSDTLCFLPLTQNQWLQLDKKYPNQVNDKFEKITDDTLMFY